MIYKTINLIQIRIMNRLSYIAKKIQAKCILNRITNISAKASTVIAPSAALGLSCLFINYAAITRVKNTETPETNSLKQNEDEPVSSKQQTDGQSVANQTIGPQNGSIPQSQQQQQKQQLRIKEPSKNEKIEIVEEDRIKQESQQEGSQSTNDKKQQEKLMTLFPTNFQEVYITRQCPEEIRKYLAKCNFKIVDHFQQLSNQNPIFLSMTNRIGYNLTQSGGLLTIQSKQRPASLEVQTSPQDKSCKLSTIHRISNFMNPPHQLTNYDEFISILQTISKQNEYLIVTYLPSEQERNKTSQNPFDTYTSSKVPDYEELERKFITQKFDSGTNQVNYCIVRDQQLAQKMKIGGSKGDVHLIHRATQNSAMEVSTRFNGQKFTIKKIFHNQPLQSTEIRYPKKLDYYTNLYLNEINIERDMENFIMKHAHIGDHRKILLVSPKEKREEFQNTIKKILMRVGKLLPDQVLVLYTNNQKLLNKYFQVDPDQFATVRLIDLNTPQVPMFIFPEHYQSASSPKFYSKKKFSGAFNVENLCKFVKESSRIEEYYEKKSQLTTLHSIVSLREEDLNDKVSIHWKNGCHGCKITLQYLESIQQIIRTLKDQTDKDAIDNLIFKYGIKQPEVLKTIQFVRYNILNEEKGEKYKNEKNHDLTPQLIYHRRRQSGGSEISRAIDIGRIIGQTNNLNPHNEQSIHVKIISDIIEEVIDAKMSISKEI